MNEAEYLMKNYGDQGGCFPSRPLAEADNTLPGARFSKVPVTFRARNQIFKSKYKE